MSTESDTTTINNCSDSEELYDSNEDENNEGDDNNEGYNNNEEEDDDDDDDDDRNNDDERDDNNEEGTSTKQKSKTSNQTTLDSFVKSTQTEKKFAMIEWIVLDMQPFKVVEGEAFRKMISKFDPKHNLPTRNTIKNWVINLFKERRESIKNYVKTIPGKVALTTDIWSSLKNEGFLGVTIHFIDSDWLLKHFTLDIFKFKGSHTGKAISDEIYKLLVEFQACILKNNISMLAVKYPNLNNNMPTQLEWELFHDLNQFLEPFDNATIDLSTQSYPTIAHSRVILLAIKIDLYVDRGEDSLLKDLIIPMKEKFETYYEVLKESTHIAAFLDPRYKSYCFPEMNDDEILQPIQLKLEQIQPTTQARSTKISTFLLSYN
ncbi:unnamed protein product [Rhizophagus irregularis]|nr:unnamed protein product [Rhizophagus irregularis]